MANATFAISVFMFFLLLLGVGAIILQIFLSKAENKWPGLIMPIISFGFSLVAALGVLLFTVQGGGSGYYSEDGELIMETYTQIADPSSMVVSAIYIFLLCNIPTAILGAIYAAYRGKRNKQRALEKMSVQDL